MKYITLFNNHTDYNTYITGQDKVLPNVSYCEDNNEVHYNPIDTVRIIATYNVTDTTNPTRLFNDSTLLNEVEIDGVVQPSVVTSYTFETTGIHTVKFRLNDSVTILDSNSFGMNTQIVSIEIPNSITSINAAFNNCTSLTSVTIPNSVTSIGGNAFGYCNKLTNIIIPNTVTSIGIDAFRSCSGLTSVSIPDSVTTIGTNAFQGCTGLTSVTIGNSVTSIGERAFYQCAGLTSITIGNSVTSIGKEAFNGCTGLTSVTSYIMAAPNVNGGTFYGVSNGGTLYVPIGSTGYETWMNNQGNLGLYNWTKVEQ